MAVLVYKYGTHSHTRLHEEAVEQLRLAHQMRNTLVAAYLNYEQQVKDLWSGYPQVAEIETQLEAAESAATALSKQAKQEHSRDRTVATRTSTATALREVRAKVKELKAARRTAIGEAYPVLKPRLEELRTGHKGGRSASGRNTPNVDSTGAPTTRSSPTTARRSTGSPPPAKPGSQPPCGTNDGQARAH